MNAEQRSNDVISLEDYEGDEELPYANEFLDFIDGAVTVYHAVETVKRELLQNGFVELREDDVSQLIHAKYFEESTDGWLGLVKSGRLWRKILHHAKWGVPARVHGRRRI
jgi:hypothetical protein